MNWNKTQFGGRLTRDPQLKFLPNQTAVCDFSIASNRKFKARDGQMREDVTYLECVAWGKTAELINQYMSKGREILVGGYLKTESWEDKQGGGKRSKIVLSVEEMQFLGANKRDGQGSAPAGEPQTPPPDDGGQPPYAEDDIPF